MKALAAIAAGSACAVSALAFSPSDARACGGTFCDGNPGPTTTAMEVDQSGENVAFVVANGVVEAHVQIQYVGDPQRFAWIIPMPRIPEVEIGSQLLFLNLLNATVPSFTLTTSYDTCQSGGGSSRSGSGSGCMGGFGSDDAGTSGDANDLGTTSGGSDEVTEEPTEELRESVGAFEVTVLQPRGPKEIDAWLVTNGYLVDSEAAFIVQEYIKRGYVFVAVKLQADAALDEIHPLVFRYEGDEPCIPLKLTRIAATQQMGVRAFFFGDRRVVPTGTFKLVTPNEARFDWLSVGSNYPDVVRRAVDEPGAAGRAFVTEYDGSSNIVPRTGIDDAAWNATPFVEAEWFDTLGILAEQGLVDCLDASSCTSPHPLVPALLREHLPAPNGVDAADFYACPSCYTEAFEPATWDGPAFAADLDARVIAPGRHAASLLDENPHLTRLFTMISPDEMTEDPTFAEAREPMPAVSARRTVSQTVDCSNTSQFDLRDGRSVDVKGIYWPGFDDAMPYAARIEQFDEAGASVGAVDNGAVIDAQIALWNQPPPPPPVYARKVKDGCGSSRSSGAEDEGIAWIGLLVAGLWLARRGRMRS